MRYLDHNCRPLREKPVWFVYLVVDDEGRRYVGATSRPVSERWYAHCTQYAQGAFHEAIKAKGKDAFKFTVLDEALSLDEARRKERRYIRELGSLAPRGYNLTPY